MPEIKELQSKLDEAWELKNQASQIENKVGDIYRQKVNDLCKQKKFSEAIDCINELNWHESIVKFDLFSLLRHHQKK